MAARKKRALALITVLMVSMVLLMIVLTGVQITGRNLFTIGRSHDRNLALYAAESGIYKTLAEIETLDRYPTDGLRPRVQLGNDSAYQVSTTRSGDLITLRSQGFAPRATRTLEVSVTLSPDSFYGVVTQGPIGSGDDTFINAVLSTLNPKPGPGNIHTNDASSGAIVAEKITPTDPQRLSVTGEATSVGQISATITGKSQTGAQFVNPQNVDRNSLLGTAVYTNIPAIPADGIIRGHKRISEVDLERPLMIEEGAVLHVTGDLALARGVTGSGTLVVDGESLVRGSETIDTNNPRGVFFYAGGGVALVHPEAARATLSLTNFTPEPATPENPNPVVRPAESHETYEYVPDPISTFFADKPADAEFNLRQGLPLDAPTDLEFFEYYEEQSIEPSEAFKLWMDGDETVGLTGLRPEVKQWLAKSKDDPEVKRRLREMKVEPR